MIDLRSDTFTVPTNEMRQVIANAPVGDDVFGEDPSVNELQDYTAELLGKEAVLFVPSGVMANQISIAVLTNTGDEVIVESDAHIFYYEAASPSIISRVQLRPLSSERGMIPEDKIIEAIRLPDDHFPPTKLICLENTHNRHGGAIIPIDYIKRIANLAQMKNLKLHCDGARLWNASAATGISMKEYASHFDTVSVCLSKGLGAPVGSLIVSSTENIKIVHRWRKILGGGMRQAGIIAAAGLYAIKNHFKLLPATHENAKKFAQIVSESELITINPESVETNMVVFSLLQNINAFEFEEECIRNGIGVLAVGSKKIRAVFHFQISEREAIEAANKTKDLINKLHKKI
jgi:threonine aldolase